MNRRLLRTLAIGLVGGQLAGAEKYGNIFSLDVGPDYNGQLRQIDAETLRKVGEMIRQGTAR